jgi:hypothetical protein
MRKTLIPRNRSLFVVLFLLSFTVAFALTPQILAQQTYSQPMYGTHWPSHTIFVSVPDSPFAAQIDFQLAIDYWNQAQQWFLASYESNHLTAQYTLELAQPGQQAQVTVQYVPDTGQNWWGFTYSAGTRISIVLSRFAGVNYGTNYSLVALAEHELGHVLGLGDSCIRQDLMLGLCNGVLLGPDTAYYPSTLDLYAVYLQALTNGGYGNGDTVSLPAQIPYAAWVPNEMPVSEFSNSFLILVAALSVTVGICKRRLPFSFT